jgi:hypothetical protein
MLHSRVPIGVPRALLLQVFGFFPKISTTVENTVENIAPQLS